MIKQTIILTDDGIIDRLNRASEITAGESRRFLEIVLAYILRLVRGYTPVNTGILRNSIFTDITGAATSMRGRVSTSSMYGESVEFGTPPHWVPIAQLILWVERKIGVSSPGAAYGIAYTIRRRIAKFGTKGAHMFSKAFEKSKRFIAQEERKLGENIANKIDRG